MEKTMKPVDDSKSKYSNKSFWRIINLLNLGLIFVIAYYFILMQVSGMIAADVTQHIAFLDQYFKGEVYIPHPIWHTGVYYLSRLLEIDLGTAASLFTAFLITLYAVIIYKVAQSLDGDPENEAQWLLITIISLTIGPFFIMSLNPNIYMGPGSPSVWHNVTLTTVQPLALLSVFFTIKFFTSQSLKYFVLAVMVMILSIFAKPNFIIVFLPSLVAYMLLKKYFNKQQLLFALVAILFSVTALAYQFANQYKSGEGSTGGSVVFDFLGVWSLYTPSVTVSILMALGLPLLITIFNFQSVKKSEHIIFSWLLVLFSMILFACFAESGKRFAEGNFSWSWHISLSLIYIFTIIEYFKQYFSMPGVVRYPLLTMMLYQVYVGWYFLIGMFNGISYRATIDAFPLF
ncbi:MAG: hypothetical protein U9R26_03690 [Campylobacterota bacterium]|nr:hypothetical protein [Campylobacterota bacterium]